MRDRSRAFNAIIAFLGSVIVFGLIGIVGLASHSDGEGNGGHPSATGRSLGNQNSINMHLRDTTTAIRVLADTASGDVDQAISRWNGQLGKAILTRVTSGSYDLRIRSRVFGSQPECGGLANFNAFYVTESTISTNPNNTCGVLSTGTPTYDQSAPGAILLGSLYSSQPPESRITGLTHEMGHDLGLDDHYYQPQTPVCRSDVDSVMEDWGCSTPVAGVHQPTAHDVGNGGDVRKAYEILGKPWDNYIAVSGPDSATFNFDTVNNADNSVHNEKVSAGMRVRTKSSLEGAVLATSYKDRGSAQGYSYSVSTVDGERCFSANGRTNYTTNEGNDGSETCMNRQNVYYGKVVGTSDTNNSQSRDYFRLCNYTFGGTITSATVQTAGGSFIAYITQPGQPDGQIQFNACGEGGNLDLAKGAYRFRFYVSGTGPYLIQLGLDD